MLPWRPDPSPVIQNASDKGLLVGSTCPKQGWQGRRPLVWCARRSSKRKCTLSPKPRPSNDSVEVGEGVISWWLLFWPAGVYVRDTRAITCLGSACPSVPGAYCWAGAAILVHLPGADDSNLQPEVSADRDLSHVGEIHIHLVGLGSGSPKVARF